MSGADKPRSPAGQPKQISSRLLNMKFMQRAVASDKTKSNLSPQTPTSERPFKRRRTGELSASQPTTPLTPYTPIQQDPSSTDHQSISRGRNNFDNNVIETEWVLNVNIPTSTTIGTQDDNGYSDQDSSDDEEDLIWSQSQTGRQTYGSFKKRPAVPSMTSETTTPTTLSKSAKRNALKKLAQEAGLNDLSQSESDTNSESHGSGSNDSESDSESHGDDYSGSESGEAASKDGHKVTRKKEIDFESEEYAKRMDAMDFNSPAFNSAFGKQRLGYMSGTGTGAYTKPGKKNNNKNRNKLGGQAFFEEQKANGNKEFRSGKRVGNKSNKKKKKKRVTM